jgi:hypothetical protein
MQVEVIPRVQAMDIHATNMGKIRSGSVFRPRLLNVEGHLGVDIHSSGGYEVTLKGSRARGPHRMNHVDAARDFARVVHDTVEHGQKRSNPNAGRY